MCRQLCSGGGGGRVRVRGSERVRGSVDTITSHTDCRPCSTLTVPPPQDPTPSSAQGNEDVIERKRNKSRLTPWHYNKEHYQPPEPLTEDEEVMQCLRNQRYRLGRYGSASGINLTKAWPSKEELALAREWEKVSYPHSIHQMIDITKKQRDDEQMAIKQR
ncbi:hypothetical protein Pcinc_035515 [Petrolisthes cinctipes]|uniref:Large ribosomal subunit protein mL64 n=1 Tax=Petrolisthes cinctipes TaxID=88211 RepID=A0AAE1BWL2_PETCI|nr:hypothetical protein Pcinc_035515 [Petrolisthes cinctipes]